MELSNPKSWRKQILRSMSVGRHIPMATFNCQSCGSRVRKVFFRRDAKLLSSEFEIAQKRRMKRAWNVWHWLWRQRRGNFLLAQKPKNIRPDSYIYHIVSTFYLVLLFLSFSLSLFHQPRNYQWANYLPLSPERKECFEWLDPDVPGFWCVPVATSIIFMFNSCFFGGINSISLIHCPSPKLCLLIVSIITLIFDATLPEEVKHLSSHSILRSQHLDLWRDYFDQNIF